MTQSFLKWPVDVEPTWQAKWIALPGIAQTPNACFRVRKRWVVDDVSGECVVHVAAESRYRLYVNGTLAGAGPVRGTWRVNFYDSYDIAQLIRAGENWIAIEVQSANCPTFKAAPVQPAVIAQINDGSVVRTDGTWEANSVSGWRSEVPLYTFQIGYIEWFGDSHDERGWETGEDVARSQWISPELLAAAPVLGGKRLIPRDVPALRDDRYKPVAVPVVARVAAVEDRDDLQFGQTMRHEAHRPMDEPLGMAQLMQPGGEPVCLPVDDAHPGTVFIFDFGREVNGALEIDIDAPAGTIVDIAFDEELSDGRLPVVLGPYLFADRYVMRAGRECVGTRFAERGFRMAQVVIRPPADDKTTVKLHGVTAIDRTYPYVQRGSFACSDPLLNEIWKRCASTIEACATDTFVDCPWRENAFYLNDMYVEHLGALQAFGDGRLGARCLRLAVSQVRSDGLVPAPVPAGIVPGNSAAESLDRMTFPAVNLLLAEMVEMHLLYDGDRQLAGELIPVLHGILAAVRQWSDEEGLLTPPARFWNFVDWSFDYKGEVNNGKCTAILNWLYVNALQCTARVARWVDASADVSELEQLAERVAGAIERRFWDEELGAYREWAEGAGNVAGRLSCAMALLTGSASDECGALLVENLSRSDLLEPELYMYGQVLRAMARGGMADRALECVRRLWGPIVLSESVTIWESGVHSHGKGAWGGAGSVCHGFSTSPIDFFQGEVLGIRPIAPGFAVCRFEPNAGDLRFARGEVPTPLGNISVSWRMTNSAIVAELMIPQGVMVELADGEALAAGKHRVKLRRQMAEMQGSY